MSEEVAEPLMTLEELQERRNKTAGKKQMVLARLANVKKMYKLLNQNLETIRQSEELYDELEAAIKRHNALKEVRDRW